MFLLVKDGGTSPGLASSGGDVFFFTESCCRHVGGFPRLIDPYSHDVISLF